MRTIRVELESPVGGENDSPLAGMFGGGMKMRISTEVIVSDDAEAREAGSDAAHVVNDFIAGYGETLT